MQIRQIKAADANKFRKLVQQVEAESDYMLYEAGERAINVEQQHAMIESITEQPNAAIFLAEEETELVGYLIAVGGKTKRTRHSVYLVIGILAGFRGRGVGTLLFQTMEAWAEEQGIHRLELTVAVPNEGGLGLYKKSGFEIEGVKRNSLYINQRYVDEYFMAKLL
ncbi:MULTISPECIES: GNAT family N-acetyltransferase [Thalassobacillus]|uniref:GNAT family N-acetyltransferase n=1 Tax=Thalassobacillus TaxID=331971 RepID=UPI000A1CB9EA|nr:GNAT family N-acetyltransferase [Thalassobacillus devorans]